MSVKQWVYSQLYTLQATRNTTNVLHAPKWPPSLFCFLFLLAGLVLTIKIPAVYPNKFCSGGISQLQQPLSGLVVGIVVCLGSRRKCAIGRPKINQWLHGLELLGLQHIQSAGREHKVRKATVELLL